MTRDEFKEIIKKINAAFPGAIKTSEQVDMWYECLKDDRADLMNRAVIEYSKHNQYQPTIAGLLECYESEAEESANIRRQLEEIYTTASHVYPGGHTDESLRAFERYVRRFPLDTRLIQAREFTHVMSEYLDDCEKCHRDTIPTFAEYIEGKR